MIQLNKYVDSCEVGSQKSTESPGCAVKVVIPPEVFEVCALTVGKFFQELIDIDPMATARDHLDLEKSLKRGAVLGRYTEIRERKLLEIGSGFGTNLAMWMKHFDVDGYGVEADSNGFSSSLHSSRQIFRANDLDPARLVEGVGENIPFGDELFDIVYSANVLEHTNNPALVLREAVRVLKPGGILHMEMPNFLALYEGHYLIFQPPIVARWVLPAWLRLLRRNATFAQTLRTEINPIWLKRRIRELGNVELISLGEEVFLERLSAPFEFEMKRVEGRLSRLVSLLQSVNRGNWIGKVVVAAQAYYPIYLTARKHPLVSLQSGTAL